MQNYYSSVVPIQGFGIENGIEKVTENLIVNIGCLVQGYYVGYLFSKVEKPFQRQIKRKCLSLQKMADKVIARPTVVWKAITVDNEELVYFHKFIKSTNKGNPCS